MKNILKWLFLTNVGRLLLLFILTPLFYYLSETITYITISNIFFYLSCLTLLILCIFVLIIIIYAWIINPLRERKETKRIQEELKNKHNL